MHQAVAFAIAGECHRNRPFTRKFCSANKGIFISFAKPFAIPSQNNRNTKFGAFRSGFGGYNSLANFQVRQNLHSHSQLYRCDRCEVCAHVITSQPPVDGCEKFFAGKAFLNTLTTFSRVWVSESESFTKVHARNGVKNCKFHAIFHKNQKRCEKKEISCRFHPVGGDADNFRKGNGILCCRKWGCNKGSFTGVGLFSVPFRGFHCVMSKKTRKKDQRSEKTKPITKYIQRNFGGW